MFSGIFFWMLFQPGWHCREHELAAGQYSGDLLSYRTFVSFPELMLRRLFLKLSFGYLLSFHPLAGAVDRPQLRSIAFGSCNRTHLPQPLWPHIESHQPDLFLWLGDVVYSKSHDPLERKKEYDKQLASPGYVSMKNSLPIIGIWDDHDYGGNNQGKENPIRQHSQKMFLDFLGEPAGSMRRKQKGIYTSYVHGSGDQQVRLILLDTRYHRDRPGTGRADILGKAQWRWLEQELKHSTAKVHLIASGYSVLSTQIPGAEEWVDFKWARKRLFNLLKKYSISGVLFVTGDRHFAAFLAEDVGGNTYHEFMSSGLTHYLYRPRISRVLRSYYGPDNSYFGINFSLLSFDWSDEARVTCRVFDKDNRQRLSRQLTLRQGLWKEEPQQRAAK